MQEESDLRIFGERQSAKIRNPGKVHLQLQICCSNWAKWKRGELAREREEEGRRMKRRWSNLY